MNERVRQRVAGTAGAELGARQVHGDRRPDARGGGLASVVGRRRRDSGTLPVVWLSAGGGPPF